MNTLYVDSTNCVTDLCKIGGEVNTDKSPFALNSACAQHRKGYTAIYNLIFSQYEYKNINFAELGIEAGASLVMWNKFFKNCEKLYAFEYEDSRLEMCKALNIPNVIYNKTDIRDKDILNKSFNDTGLLFDIIIDDTTHIIEHQNVIIENVWQFLKPGGILIIEDIYRNTDISAFNIDTEKWSFYTFIVAHHNNRNCWDHDKLLYLIRK